MGRTQLVFHFITLHSCFTLWYISVCIYMYVYRKLYICIVYILYTTAGSNIVMLFLASLQLKSTVPSCVLDHHLGTVSHRPYILLPFILLSYILLPYVLLSYILLSYMLLPFLLLSYILLPYILLPKFLLWPFIQLPSYYGLTYGCLLYCCLKYCCLTYCCLTYS